MLSETADMVVAAIVCLHNFIMTEEENNREKTYSQGSQNIDGYV